MFFALSSGFFFRRQDQNSTKIKLNENLPKTQGNIEQNSVFGQLLS